VAGREHPSRCSLGSSLQLPLSHLFPGMGGCSLDSWRDEARLCPPTFQLQHVNIDAALPFSRQVTAPTPHTTGRLLAVSPDMAKFLAVVTLCEASLGLFYS
jgi:hypothetical protein